MQHNTGCHNRSDIMLIIIEIIEANNDAVRVCMVMKRIAEGVNLTDSVVLMILQKTEARLLTGSYQLKGDLLPPIGGPVKYFV